LQDLFVDFFQLRGIAVFQDPGIDTVGRLQKLQQIAAVVPADVTAHYHRRILVYPSGKLCRYEIGLVFIHILRADEVGDGINILLLFRVFQIFPAKTTELVGIVHLGDFCFVGNQIVVEIPGGTVVQAAAVGKKEKPLAVTFAPGMKLLNGIKVPVQFPLHIKAVKEFREVIHGLHCTDLHIDRGPNFQSREVVMDKLGNQRGGCGDGLQAVSLLHMVDDSADFIKKASCLGFLAVAIGIEEQIQSNVVFRQLPQSLPLQILQLPGCVAAAFQLIGPPVGKFSPGEVNLVDVLPVFKNTIQKCPVGILQADHVFHSTFPLFLLDFITIYGYIKYRKQTSFLRKQTFVVMTVKFCDINPFVRIASRNFHRSEEDRVWVKDCRLFYVLSGCADMCVENQRYAMAEGDLFYCRTGICYGIISEGVELICVNFDLDQHNNAHFPSYPRNDARKLPPEVAWEQVQEETFLNTWLYLPGAQAYLGTLQSLLEEFSTQQIYYRERCSGILKTILLQLHRQSIAASTGSAEAVADTIAYIKAHFGEMLTNKQLSERTGYHEYYLNRLFLRQTGTSIHKYILNTRIGEAKKLLLNTDVSLSKIAEAVGFNSNTHFSTYFRQTVGISPLEYRTQFKNKV